MIDVYFAEDGHARFAPLLTLLAPTAISAALTSAFVPDAGTPDASPLVRR